MTTRAGVIGAAAVLLLGVAGCGSDSGAAVSSTATSAPSSAASGAGTSTAASADPSSAASASPSSSSAADSSTSSADAAAPAYVGALQPKLDEIMKELSVTGAVVLIRSPDRGDWSVAMGTRTWHGSDPVTVADHIRIGSNTKTWTGTVILQLVDEGKISLSDPVSKYRPDVPNGANITIAQMLSMTSGLGNYTPNPDLNEQMDINPTRAWQPEELVTLGLAAPLAFSPPGSSWSYSNTNTVLLGLIIEQLTGEKLENVFQTRIFDKLGLTDTSFPAITDNTMPDPHPHGYTYGTNAGTIDSLVLSPEVQAGAADGTLQPLDVTDVNPSWGWSAGAGISTADDLADYVEALVGGGLLSPELQQQRLDSLAITDPGDPASALYGWALGGFGPYFGHSGELPGFNSFMGYDPVTKTTVVTWASLAPAADGQAPAVQLAKAVIGALAS